MEIEIWANLIWAAFVFHGNVDPTVFLPDVRAIASDALNGFDGHFQVFGQVVTPQLKQSNHGWLSITRNTHYRK